MALITGARLGPYEILAALGAGGMGEVYKARDTRLDRTVAIKILPASLAADPQFRDRFDREARTISQLDHPHICTLYDVGEQDGVSFLVMQYLEGETLEHRLKKGALPINEALIIAIQIADALDKAHRAGIVHRDLKPGNIMLTKAGAKLLDFGLAKAGAPIVAGAGLSMLPTSPPHLTAQGTILGTFQYMAPEQLEGREADARTDLFAFGAVVYEMLTGAKAFEGKSHASLIAAIMHVEPPTIASLQPLAPASLEHVVKACLEKDPDMRWQSAGDLTRELRWISDSFGTLAPPAGAFGTSWWRPWALAALAIVIAFGWAFVHIRETPAAPRTVRFQIPPPGKTIARGFKLSPDGRYLAFNANEGGSPIWVQPLDALQAQPLAGTDDASFIFWSPDSAFIGFFAKGKLKKIAVAGGLPQTIGDAPTGRSGTWNREGVIVFAPTLRGGLYRVSEAGGVQTPVTKLPSPLGNSDSHRFPAFLPDGRRFLYVCLCEKAEAAGVYVGSLDGTPPVRILPGSDAVYAPAVPGRNGYLLFRQEETLMAQPFDPERLHLTGDAFPYAAPIDSGEAQGSAAVSVTESGVLAYRTGSRMQSGNRELVWLDRTGTRLGVITKPDAIQTAALSPDEKTVAFDVSNATQSSVDVWLEDLKRGATSRLTFGPGTHQRFPLWSPDSSRIVFTTDIQRVGLELYKKPASGVGREELLLHFPLVNAVLDDWSRDGKFIVYSQTGEKTREDLWLLPLGGDQKPFPYLQTRFNELRGQFSLDGRWMAYDSDDESGQPRVYVQTVPPGGSKVQISATGGSQPRWRRDGKELFYVSADGELMAVPVTLTPGLEVGTPQSLFRGIPVQGPRGSFAYQPSADGQRFLVNVPTNGEGGAAATPLTVVLNWQSALGARERR